MENLFKIKEKNEFERKSIEKLKCLLIVEIIKDNELENKIIEKEGNLDKCWSFIKSEIRKRCHKGNSYGATDDEVLGLAIHYFIDVDVSKDNFEEDDLDNDNENNDLVSLSKTNEKLNKINKKKKNNEIIQTIWDYLDD